MPFIRYRIGDLGIAATKLCRCGRGLPLLERVEGRLLDAVRTPDGRIVPGEFFPHLFKEFDSVKQFQVVQKTLHDLHVKLVLRDAIQAADVPRIEEEIRNVLGTSISVRVELVSDIPVAASGKFRVTVSEL
jgi:phenylacetate-CoA ligase